MFHSISIILPLSLFLSLSVEGSQQSKILINSIQVDSTVLERRSSIIVTMSNGTKSTLSMIKSQAIESDTENALAIMRALEAHSESTQAPVANFLKRLGISFQSFWISNQIYIRDGSPSVVIALLNALNRESSIVSEIREEIAVPMMPTFDISETGRTNNITWGVERMGAPKAWDTYGVRGKGVIAAVIDTGCDSSHKDLQGKLVGWKDATLTPLPGVPFPVDEQGHGTHVTGTIVGGGGTGVAPDAKYLACKACSSLFCMEAPLIECGQFVVCPDPDFLCSKSADVVSCSWGGDGGGVPFYDKVIKTWRDSRIIPVFAIGNSGAKGCNMAGYPGGDPRVIGVGAVDVNRKIAPFSSRGPSTLHAGIKPDVSAPGVNISSCSNLNKKGYKTLSGTSMGWVALLLSKNNTLDFDQILKILKTTSDKNLISSEETCRGIADTTFPNHIFGFGQARCDTALEALNGRG